MKPLISVVMATYNGQSFIKEAIQSVLDQTITDFEFIIIDDGSTDETQQIVLAFNDDRIQYIKKEHNSGISDSLNIGISLAKGKYIARMDDDDVCLPIRFEKQLEVFNTYRGLVFCGSNVLDNDSKPLRTPEKHEDIQLELLFRNPIFHPTALILKDVLLKHKYNVESVPSEDYDLWSRLIFEGDFYQLQEPLLYCRIHQTSVTATRRHEQLSKNIDITKYMFKHIGFDLLEGHDENVSIFARHDYTISGKQLSGLMKWLEGLKKVNKDNEKFQIGKFNTMVDVNLKRYLFSFFTNQKIGKKIAPFLHLKLKHKIYVISFYLNKLTSKPN